MPVSLIDISPYLWASTGVVAAIGLSALGSAIGIATAGPSILGAAIVSPERIIIAIILQLQIKQFPEPAQAQDFFAGFGMLGAGLMTGLSNLGCGIALGLLGSAGISYFFDLLLLAALASGQIEDLFVKLLITEVFASALGLFGVIVGIIAGTKAFFQKFSLSSTSSPFGFPAV